MKPIKINLDEQTAELIEWHAAATGLTVSDLIDRLLLPQLAPLHELRALMETHKADVALHEQAANLLVSFGPESIMDGIKRIAPPNYETLEAQFMRSLDASIGPTKATLQ